MEGGRGRCFGGTEPAARRFKSLPIDPECAHGSKEKNTHGITEIHKTREIKPPDLEWRFRETMVDITFPSPSPIQDGNGGRF